MDRVAANIDRLRKTKKWSVDRLAKEANIPVVTLTNVRRKINDDLRVGTLIAIATALDVSLDELVG
jgi:transcriptional regulator with XRE-family HTH domain